MTTVEKILIFGVSVLGFAAFISIGYAVYSSGKQAYRRVDNSLQERFAVTDEWGRYSGRVVSGSDIHYLVGKGDAIYRVITKECPQSFCQFSTIAVAGSEHYVDPVDKFVCSTLFSQRGEPIGLLFTQVGLRDYRSNEDYNSTVLALEGELRRLEQYESNIDARIANAERQLDKLEKEGGNDSEYKLLERMKSQYESLLEESASLDSQIYGKEVVVQ